MATKHLFLNITDINRLDDDIRELALDDSNHVDDRQMAYDLCRDGNQSVCLHYQTVLHGYTINQEFTVNHMIDLEPVPSVQIPNVILQQENSWAKNKNDLLVMEVTKNTTPLPDVVTIYGKSYGTAGVSCVAYTSNLDTIMSLMDSMVTTKEQKKKKRRHRRK